MSTNKVNGHDGFARGAANPSDPLRKVNTSSAEQLLMLLAPQLTGVPYDTVEEIAANLLISAIRQANPSRRGAEIKFDNLMNKVKGVLLDGHYDRVTGNRRNIFPYTQFIHAEYHDDRKTKG